MRISPLARYVAGGTALAVLGYAVAVGAVVPFSIRSGGDVPPAQAPKTAVQARTAQNAAPAQGGSGKSSAAAASNPYSYAPSEVPADKSVSFPADI